MNRVEIVEATPICTKCGKPLNEVVMPFFQHDGDDADERRPFTCTKNDDGTYTACIDADRNWCGYESSDEEKKECIRCPHCKKYPFDDESEVEESEPLVVLCWTAEAQEKPKQSQSGNVAALREAVGDLLYMAERYIKNTPATESVIFDAKTKKEIRTINYYDVIAKAKAALSEPERNCDRFRGPLAYYESLDVYIKEEERPVAEDGKDNSPFLSSEEALERMNKYRQWLFDEAKEGDTDGSK